MAKLKVRCKQKASVRRLLPRVGDDGHGGLGGITRRTVCGSFGLFTGKGVEQVSVAVHKCVCVEDVEHWEDEVEWALGVDGWLSCDIAVAIDFDGRFLGAIMPRGKWITRVRLGEVQPSGEGAIRRMEDVFVYPPRSEAWELSGVVIGAGEYGVVHEDGSVQGMDAVQALRVLERWEEVRG